MINKNLIIGISLILFIIASITVGAITYNNGQLIINYSTGIQFQNTSINQTHIISDNLIVNNVNYTDTINQGVRTTDSPTFVNITGNVSGQNVSAKKIGGIIYTDQYATIQDALDVARANGGGTVQLPVGNISFTNTLVVSNNTILKGHGMNATNLFWANTTNNTFAAIYSYCAHYQSTLSCMDSNIQLEDFTLDANRNGRSHTANTGYGIAMQWVQNLRIENVWVKNAYSSGISVWPFRPVDVSLYQYGENVIRGVRVTDNGVGAQGLDAGLLVSCCQDWNSTARIIISDVTALRNNPNGIGVEDAQDVIISNSQAYNNTEFGFAMQAVTRVSFSNVKARYNKNGLGHSSAIGENWITVTGSDFSENEQYGIKYQGHNWNILGNQINWNGYSGIYSDGYRAVINGNTINGNGVNTSAPNRAGIYLLNNGYNGNHITNNVISKDPNAQKLTDSQQYGIQEGNAITGSPVNIYAENDLTWNAVAGILFNATTNSRARNNIPIAPFDFGNNATAPSDVSFGNTYKNSTSGDGTCYATGSEYRNATGNTVVC